MGKSIWPNWPPIVWIVVCLTIVTIVLGKCPIS